VQRCVVCVCKVRAARGVAITGGFKQSVLAIRETFVRSDERVRLVSWWNAFAAAPMRSCSVATTRCAGAQPSPACLRKAAGVFASSFAKSVPERYSHVVTACFPASGLRAKWCRVSRGTAAALPA